MRISPGRLLLQVVGGLCVLAGLLLWVGLALSAMSDPDSLTPQSDAGGRLLTWALGGMLLMILGLALLQFEGHAAEDEACPKGEPPRE